jgi:hypothetical protein
MREFTAPPVTKNLTGNRWFIGIYRHAVVYTEIGVSYAALSRANRNADTYSRVRKQTEKFPVHSIGRLSIFREPKYVPNGDEIRKTNRSHAISWSTVWNESALALHARCKRQVVAVIHM